jgi:hypothetical protein
MFHALGQSDQQMVAHIVPVLVIDRFESIQVQKDHGHRFFMPARLKDGLLQTVTQQNTVGQFGQGIEVSHLLQLNLVLLEAGNV